MNSERYRRPELQEAYEQGYSQMLDHDAVAFADRMFAVAERAAPGMPAEAMAAVFHGAADALRALASESRLSGREAPARPRPRGGPVP